MVSWFGLGVSTGPIACTYALARVHAYALACVWSGREALCAENRGTKGLKNKRTEYLLLNSPVVDVVKRITVGLENFPQQFAAVVVVGCLRCARCRSGGEHDRKRLSVRV
jgi:hypothetical protein